MNKAKQRGDGSLIAICVIAFVTGYLSTKWGHEPVVIDIPKVASNASKGWCLSKMNGKICGYETWSDCEKARAYDTELMTSCDTANGF